MIHQLLNVPGPAMENQRFWTPAGLLLVLLKILFSSKAIAWSWSLLVARLKV